MSLLVPDQSRLFRVRSGNSLKVTTGLTGIDFTDLSRYEKLPDCSETGSLACRPANTDLPVCEHSGTLPKLSPISSVFSCDNALSIKSRMVRKARVAGEK